MSAKTQETSSQELEPRELSVEKALQLIVKYLDRTYETEGSINLFALQEELQRDLLYNHPDKKIITAEVLGKALTRLLEQGIIKLGISGHEAALEKRRGLNVWIYYPKKEKAHTRRCFTPSRADGHGI